MPTTGRSLIQVHGKTTDDQIGWWERICTVTERTPIEQGIDSNAPIHLLEQAIETAQNRGRIGEANGRSLPTRMRTNFAYRPVRRTLSRDHGPSSAIMQYPPSR